MFPLLVELYDRDAVKLSIDVDHMGGERQAQAQKQAASSMGQAQVTGVLAAGRWDFGQFGIWLVMPSCTVLPPGDL